MFLLTAHGLGAIVPDCLLKAPHTPVFKVRDTVNKYGRYSKVNKTITFESADIDRFQILQWDYARLLVNRPWQETAQLLVVPTSIKNQGVIKDQAQVS